ncbi:MAG TPA: fumarylacetoacetate hydrolase family protein [Verrucomicrobiaceae bacterium]|jgi:2-dehydro-3-deoxy-D-arabinonate dehydratase
MPQFKRGLIHLSGGYRLVARWFAAMRFVLMILYQTPAGPVVEIEGRHVKLRSQDWDWLINHDHLAAWLRAESASPLTMAAPRELLAPIGTQEVWAAGVTYVRSRTARMDESKETGGGSFYDRVYEASRPEIFFKATPQRVVGPGGVMHRRRDSKWIVPEPELALVINRRGQIIGCTCGNDLSCRDIEGENPLYLPQAKVFQRCVSLGPGILVLENPIAPGIGIGCEIMRAGSRVFFGETTLAQMKRQPAELVEWLFREDAFPQGAILLTGTGIVPPDDFSLQQGDEVRISIDGIGTLVNAMD